MTSLVDGGRGSHCVRAHRRSNLGRGFWVEASWRVPCAELTCAVVSAPTLVVRVIAAVAGGAPCKHGAEERPGGAATPPPPSPRAASSCVPGLQSVLGVHVRE